MLAQTVAQSAWPRVRALIDSLRGARNNHDGDTVMGPQRDENERPSQNPFTDLADGLGELLSRYSASVTRKALPSTLKLSRALRSESRRYMAPPPAYLLLDAMHESWEVLDYSTRRAFKACLKTASDSERMPLMN